MTRTEADIAFGNAVKDARLSTGWTQEFLRLRLQEDCDVHFSKTALSRLETGDRPTRFNEFHALAELLSIDPVALKVDYTRAEIRSVERHLREAEIEADRLRARLAKLRAEGGR